MSGIEHVVWNQKVLVPNRTAGASGIAVDLLASGARFIGGVVLNAHCS